MKVTFFSNFLNHHQLPFCNEMQKILGSDFKFVATEKIPKERLDLGYEDMNDKYKFVVKSYEDEDKAKYLAQNSDVIIIGSAPKKYVRMAQKNNKLIFRYSERRFRRENFFKKILKFIYIFINNTCLERDVYMLCASAFTARDYNLTGAYVNRCFKWGYFPEIIKYKSIDDVISKKEDNSMIWVARFIDVKHPEYVVNLAKKLRDNNYNFTIKMIGIGPLKSNIESMIKLNHLEKYITLFDSMSPLEVRKHMENSQIYLFTSDKGEGWGAVLNESMNSGCAVIADCHIGSVPFLIENEKNGLIYRTESELYDKTIELLNNKNYMKLIGKNSYITMLNEWNPQIAAKRFLNIASSLLLNNGEKIKCNINKLYNSGPCSKATFLRNNWM